MALAHDDRCIGNNIDMINDIDQHCIRFRWCDRRMCNIVAAYCRVSRMSKSIGLWPHRIDAARWSTLCIEWHFNSSVHWQRVGIDNGDDRQRFEQIGCASGRLSYMVACPAHVEIGRIDAARWSTLWIEWHFNSSVHWQRVGIDNGDDRQRFEHNVVMLAHWPQSEPINFK